MIPETTTETLVEAMDRFDREFRDNPEWVDWENKESHKYAIERKGQTYPVKKVVSLATNIPVASFSGGSEANAFVEKLGFRVMPLRAAEIQESTLQKLIQQILRGYNSARTSGAFGGAHPISRTFARLKNAIEDLPALRHWRTLRVAWSVGKGNWARVPWVAIMDSQESDAPRGGVYCVYLFRGDMTGVYATLNQGVTKPKQELGALEARKLLKQNADKIRRRVAELARQGFHLDDQIDLRAEGLGAEYEASTIAYKLYEKGQLPTDAEMVEDLDSLLRAYATALKKGKGLEAPMKDHEDKSPNNRLQPTSDFDRAGAIQELIQGVESAGFVYEPWQIASYVSAIRTKPFVILAGVSGTGKSKLPAVIARLTGGESQLIAVRPDWIDSSDVLGYIDLQGMFRPGQVLATAKKACAQPGQLWTCIIDEMNLARVEQYFAEILSHIEARHRVPDGGFATSTIIGLQVREEDKEWAEVILPPNLIIVGTVNMDETTHGFSRKVLDRAFTIELSDVDLSRWITAPQKPTGAIWPVTAWHPRAITLSGLSELSEAEIATIDRTVEVLTAINGFLEQAQLQVGYRTRDEVALFCLHADEINTAFVTRNGAAVDTLDLAIHMKVLPRIIGGSGAMRRAVLQLLGWARTGKPFVSEIDAQPVLDEWIDIGRPGALPDSRFPKTAARLCIMWERFLSEGYTSYWL